MQRLRLLETSKNAAALALLLENRTRPHVRRLLATHGEPIRALAATGSRAMRRIGALQQSCEQLQVRLVAHDECDFPVALTTIPDPPLVVYLTGCRRGLAQPAVAIVGARRATVTGREIAARLAGSLAQAGFLIVSGLALGIDGAAHSGALTGGLTAAVLGNGLGRIQPVTNHGLARRILDADGFLLSEYPLRSRADRYRFPERNRLISGLSAAVLVVEAGESSGSLITARLALEQGREVLAVPGSLNHPNSRGVNRLLKRGAGLVETAQDVLDALGHLSPQLPVRKANPQGSDVSAEALALLATMSSAAVGTDELCRRLELSAERVAVLCTELELFGFVARTNGGYIRRPLM